MLAVGYSTAPFGFEYVIVRNSWGTEWGNEGYAYVWLDPLSKKGTCGIYFKNYRAKGGI